MAMNVMEHTLLMLCSFWASKKVVNFLDIFNNRSNLPLKCQIIMILLIYSPKETFKVGMVW